MKIQVLRRDSLSLGGFAGLKEHRLVMSPEIWGDQVEPGTWPGIGRLIYLSDARFNPRGETHLHPHREIDVISVMVAGRITHAGSLEHGRELKPADVQVQRAGGEGFEHNEINPDDTPNRMIQIWMAPEVHGVAAAYKHYRPAGRGVTRVYGGPPDQEETFPAETVMDVADLEAGDEISADGEFLAYVIGGQGTFGDTPVTDGDLVRGESSLFTAGSAARIILFGLQPLSGDERRAC